MIEQCRCGNRESGSGVTGITRGRRRNVCRRLPDGQHAIMATDATGRQFIEDAAGMAGFTIENLVRAVQLETRNQVIKTQRISDSRTVCDSGFAYGKSGDVFLSRQRAIQRANKCGK